jgi:hypothetical protein
LPTVSVNLKKTPQKWLKNVKLPKNLAKLKPGWQQHEILTWFKRYGVAFFEPLEIWHLPLLRQKFRRAVGREPKSLASNSFIATMLKNYWRCQSIIKSLVKQKK